MQSGMFRRLVTANAVKLLTLSVTGMVDTAVAGQFIGSEGLAAMKLAMPVFYALSFISVILGSGVTIVISKELAIGRNGRADEAFGSVVTAAVIISAVSMLGGICGYGSIFRSFAGTYGDESVAAMAADYLTVIMIGALPVIMNNILTSVALLEGDDRCLIRASVAIIVIDVVGDASAVMLNSGLKGIAVASVAAFCGTTVLIAMHFRKGRSMFTLRLIRPNGRDVLNSAVLGAPMGVTEMCALIWPVVFNLMMIRYGSLGGLAAVSIQDAARFFPESVGGGIAAATLLLTGIFAAEQDRSALGKEREDIVRWSFGAGTATALVFACVTPLIVWLCTDDQWLHDESVKAILMYLPGVPFAAANASAAAYLQGLGKYRLSGMCIFIRCLVLPVLFGWVLGSMYGEAGLYASFASAEITMTLMLAVLILMARGKSDAMTRLRRYLYGFFDEVETERRWIVRTIAEAVQASVEVRSACIEHGIAPSEAHHLALCTEELAVNSIEHGFDDGRDHTLDVRLLIGKDELILRLRDDCRRFDLISRYKMINPDDPESGPGLRIVFASADDVSYSSALNLNNVCIRIIRRSE